MQSSVRKKVSVTIIGLLAIVAIALAVALAVLPNARYNAGVKQGETKQLEVLKNDRHRGVVPNLVGQNANQVGYWSLGGPMRIKINNTVSLGADFITQNGEEITADNAKGYKVVSQEPKAGTIFDVQYEKDSNGKEYDNLVNSTGIEDVTLTLEKVNK